MLAGGRFTLPAESRYSPTEGECLAVAVGLEQSKSKFYTLGCPRLYIATDHKPMVGILCDRALDTIGDPRIVSIEERSCGGTLGSCKLRGRANKQLMLCP